MEQQLLYSAAFGSSALACLVSSYWAKSKFSNSFMRNALVSLLVLSGVWGLSTTGHILAESRALMEIFYTVGLVAGLGTVPVWIAFASSYTGLTLHRSRGVQIFLIVIYTSIVVVKLTNAAHGFYYTSSLATEPFPYLVIEETPLFWFVSLLAYVGSGVGFYALMSAFYKSKASSGVLLLLGLTTVLPMIPNVIGWLRPDILLPLSYEPLGVALFSVGVVALARRDFLTVHIAGRGQFLSKVDYPVFILDSDGTVIDVNKNAEDCELGIEVGDQVSSLPEPFRKAYEGSDSELYETVVDETPRTYYINESEIEIGSRRIGTVLRLTDITEAKRNSRVIEKQEDRTGEIVDSMNHHLRNELSILYATLDSLKSDGEKEVAKVEESAMNIEDIVEGTSEIISFGRPVKEYQKISISDATQEAAARTDGIVDIECSQDGTVEGSRCKFVEMLAQAAKQAEKGGGEKMLVAAHSDRIEISYDGCTPNLDSFNSSTEFSLTTEQGLHLALLRALCQAHGWESEAEELESGKSRITITGVQPVLD